MNVRLVGLSEIAPGEETIVSAALCESPPAIVALQLKGAVVFGVAVTVSPESATFTRLLHVLPLRLNAPL